MGDRLRTAGAQPASSIVIGAVRDALVRAASVPARSLSNADKSNADKFVTAMLPSRAGEARNARARQDGNRRPRRAILRCLALTAMLGFNASAQTPAATILTVEIENVVEYQENFASQQKNGTSTVMEAPISGPATFSPGYFIADIVTINGRKSKGTTLARDLWMNLSGNPSGSQAIADIRRFQAMEILLEIQQADGTSIGTIVLTGVTGGAPPLGAPKSAPTGNFAVIGVPVLSFALEARQPRS